MLHRFSTVLVLTLSSAMLFLAGCRGPHLGDRLVGGPIGCGGLIVLILAIYALVNIINSSADTGTKVLWAVLVFFLPLLGFILWFFFGPRPAK